MLPGLAPMLPRRVHAPMRQSTRLIGKAASTAGTLACGHFCARDFFSVKQIFGQRMAFAFKCTSMALSMAIFVFEAGYAQIGPAFPRLCITSAHGPGESVSKFC